MKDVFLLGKLHPARRANGASGRLLPSLFGSENGVAYAFEEGRQLPTAKVEFYFVIHLWALQQHRGHERMPRLGGVRLPCIAFLALSSLSYRIRPRFSLLGCCLSATGAVCRPLA